jgi:zinc-ribbon domain
MQCTSCGTTLQPGVTTCPSCGASVSTDTADASPYEAYNDTVPYIPYSVPTEAEASKPTGPPSPETPASQQHAYTPDSPADSTALPETLPVWREAEQPTANQDSQASELTPINSEPLAGTVVEPPPVQQKPLPPTQPAPPPRRGPSAGVTILFIILVLLLIGGGGGLTYYATVFHPAELHAQATAVARNVLAEATAQIATLSPQELYTQVTSRNPTINDPLVDTIWDIGPHCTVTNGTYQASVSSKNEIAFCLALVLGTDFHDVAFQARVTILKGDVGGLIFRSSFDAADQLQSYFFGIDSSGGYQLFTLQNNLRRGTSPAARTGLNQANLLTVIAHGHTFYLYVNKQFITSMSDETFASGGIGFFALDTQNPTEIGISNAQAWIL